MTEGTGRSSPAPKEWNANAYHQLSEPQFAWGLRVLDRLALAGGQRVLDAVCGSGRLTRELARRASGHVVGCDLSENMARAAAESLGEVNADSVVCADLSVLPFRAGAFDVVFSTATFHWILNHDRLFREIHRVLCAGGQLEAQCGGGPNLALVHARADALAAGSPFRPYFARWREPWRFASAGETEACLERCGFTSAHCWLEEAPARFTDADHYRAFLETVVMRPYLARLGAPELRHRFLDRLVTMAAADEAPFTLDYWRLNISAKA